MGRGRLDSAALIRIRREPWDACRLRHLSNGQEHPHLTAVLLVLLSKGAEKIPFLELKRNQDVARRRDREEKMAGRHPRGRPEGHEAVAPPSHQSTGRALRVPTRELVHFTPAKRSGSLSETPACGVMRHPSDETIVNQTRVRVRGSWSVNGTRRQQQSHKNPAASQGSAARCPCSLST
jgi:hypothetical protein